MHIGRLWADDLLKKRTSTILISLRQSKGAQDGKMRFSEKGCKIAAAVAMNRAGGHRAELKLGKY